MAIALIALALTVPELAASAIPGVIVGGTATVLFGRVIWGLSAAAILAVLTWIAVLINVSPIAAGVFMALLGLGMGLSGRRGLRAIALTIVIFTAGSLFPLTPPSGAPGSVQAASSMALAVIVGGVLATVMFRVAGRGHHPPLSPPTAWPDLIVQTITLSVTLGIATALVLTWDRTTVAAWLLITIVVLAQPHDDVTLRRSIERVAGTLGGALAVGAIALVVHVPWQAIAIGLVLAVAAWSYRFSHPEVEQGHHYWIYALIWTPAMVLLAVPQGGSATLAADTQRAGLTIIAAISVVLVSVLARKLVLLRPQATNAIT